MEDKENFKIDAGHIAPEDIDKYMKKLIEVFNRDTPMEFIPAKLTQIEELVKSESNDMELGKKVRNLFK